VFATAFDDYAIRAFEVEAVDYLLKPFARARVEESRRRVRARLERGNDGLDVEAVLKRLEEGRKSYIRQIPGARRQAHLLVASRTCTGSASNIDSSTRIRPERAFMTNFTLRSSKSGSTPSSSSAPTSEPGEHAPGEGDRPVVRRTLQAGHARSGRQRGAGEPRPGTCASREAPLVTGSTLRWLTP
jgi:hypothetical protein